MLVGIFYGTNTGYTEVVSQMLEGIMKENGFEVDLYDMTSTTVEDIAKYDYLVIASSTWNDGELQDDWDAVLPEYKEIDFTGKKVAFVGLGDQDGYPDNFLDAIGILAKPVLKNGGKVVGYWSAEGYHYTESVGIAENGMFYGVAIDQDNEEDLTEGRLRKWVDQLKTEFAD